VSLSDEPRIELHGDECSCRGGAWVLLEATQQSPCGTSKDAARLVLGLAEWRQLGKPASLALYKDAQGRAEQGERRQFQRFEVAMKVRIARIPSWRDPTSQSEETLADVIAEGGALVRSRMAVDKGEMIRFAVGEAYDTRAEVMYVSGSDGVQRLGLRFLDAPLPQRLIPPDARPLP
jgi:hypothetical protein